MARQREKQVAVVKIGRNPKRGNYMYVKSEILESFFKMEAERQYEVGATMEATADGFYNMTRVGYLPSELWSREAECLRKVGLGAGIEVECQPMAKENAEEAVNRLVNIIRTVYAGFIQAYLIEATVTAKSEDTLCAS